MGRERVTASSAYLSHKPANLDVMIGSQVARVIFEESKAVGVELLNGTKRMFFYNDLIVDYSSVLPSLSQCKAAGLQKSER